MILVKDLIENPLLKVIGKKCAPISQVIAYRFTLANGTIDFR